MTTTVVATLTSGYLAKLPQMELGIIPFAPITYFKVGGGGWVLNGSGVRVARAPDQTLTDLDIVADATRSTKRYNVGESLGYFRKSLSVTDMHFDSPATGRIVCTLDTSDYVTVNAGTLIYDAGAPYGAPVIWEMGVFDSDDLMVAYGTFSTAQTKGTSMLANAMKITCSV